MRRSLTAVVTLAWTAGVAGQESLLTRVPREWSNVGHFRDVVPHLESALGSERLHELWRAASPALARIDPSFPGVAPRMLVGPLTLFRDQIPAELVVAWPEDTVAAAGALVEAVVRLGAGWQVCERSGFDEPALASFREDAAQLMAAVGTPRALVAARMRTERAAETVFEQLMAELEGQDPRLRIDGEVLSYRTNGDALVDGGVGWKTLDALGVLPSEHAATGELRTALAAVTIDLELARDGAVLVLRLGPADDGAMREGDGFLWDAGPIDGEPVFDMVWDAAVAVAHAATANELLMSLDEEVLESMILVDPVRVPGLIDRLGGMAETQPRGGFRVHVAADGLEAAERVPLVEWIPPLLATTGIWRAVPDGATVVAATSFWTFDEWAYSLYDGLIVDLDELSMRAIERDITSVGEWGSEASWMLMWQFEGVWDLLAGDESAVFADGALIVADGSRAPHIAIVGLPESTAAARAFFVALTENVADGMGGGAIDGDPIAEFELAPGVTAWAPRIRGLPDREAADRESGCFPHAVCVADLFVLSTSVELTQSIIAASRREGVGAPAADLVTVIRGDGAALGRFARAIGSRFPANRRATEPLRGALEAAAVFLDALGTCRMEERRVGDELHTSYTLRLRD